MIPRVRSKHGGGVVAALMRFQHTSSTNVVKVNAWTEWGTLRDVLIGDAHGACFIPSQPALRPTA